MGLQITVLPIAIQYMSPTTPHGRQSPPSGRCKHLGNIIRFNDSNSGLDPACFEEPVMSIEVPIRKTDGNSGSPIPPIKPLLLFLASLSSERRLSNLSALTLSALALSSGSNWQGKQNVCVG